MEQNMLKIGVVMGGPSSEHDISLMTGKNVAEHLRGLGHAVTQIYITKTGNWLLNNGSSAYDPIDVCNNHDMMFNAMHGEFGEDGQIQQIFDRCNVRYTGSGTTASALSMNKIITKQIFNKAGIITPRSLAFEREDIDIRRAMGMVHNMAAPPWVVKPASRGSSVGVTIAKTTPALVSALDHAFSYDSHILVEEFIKGREITCGVLEEFAGEPVHALHPLEIIPPAGKFFDYDVKYDGSTEEIPAPFFGEMLRNIKAQAVRAHSVLGCRHYSRTDMIIKGTRIYVLETNTLPGLTRESLFPKQAALAKLEFPQLLEHLVRLAIQ
jgi:D-alanine-D-alanine ligase